MTNNPIRLNKVGRSFGSVKVFEDLSLDIGKGELVVLVGPSGCGKTTLLHLISGHLSPSTGTVERSGLMRTIYQNDGLFPWLTASENIDMGLRAVAERSTRVSMREELIRLIRLEGFENHYPHQLSGGMKQRVELARALAGNSDTLLMDEPFSALDYQTRLRMRRELVRLLAQKPRTVVFVTHDIEEAAELADRVLVLSERPAQIKSELRLATPRPRDLTDPEVLAAIEKITRELDLYNADPTIPALPEVAAADMQVAEVQRVPTVQKPIRSE
jgi:NitT/TauT family transport system ATP-binding protein